MDYCKELRELLRPLGIYSGSIANAELDAIGAELNGILAELEQTEQESNPMTAEDWGLREWTALLPFSPASQTLSQQRQAIAALMQVDGGSFTCDGINRTLAGCGIPAAAEEGTQAMTVTVRFPGMRGVPAQFGTLKKHIESILPCHLTVNYAFVYLLWENLEALFAAWTGLEAGAASWTALEALNPAA